MTKNIIELIRTPVKTSLIIILFSLACTILIIEGVIYYNSIKEIKQLERDFSAIGTVIISDPETERKENDKREYSDEMERVRDVQKTNNVASPYSVYYEPKDIELIAKSKNVAQVYYNKYLGGYNKNIKFYDSSDMYGRDSSNTVFLRGKFVSATIDINDYKCQFEIEEIVNGITKVEVGQIINIKAPKYQIKNSFRPKDDYFEINPEYEDTSVIIKIWNMSSNKAIFNYDVYVDSIYYNEIPIDGIVYDMLNQNGCSVYFTENINSFIPFNEGKMQIVEGESIKNDATEKTCIISNTLARLNNLKVGDSIELTHILCLKANKFGNNIRYISYLDYTDEIYEKLKNIKKEDEVSYKIVGIYNNFQANVKAPYNFDENTIFVPMKDYPKDLSNYINLSKNEWFNFYEMCSDFLLPYTFSFAVSDSESFNLLKEEVKNTDLNGRFSLDIMDNGYELLKEKLDSMKLVTLYLLIIVLITVFLIILAILYLYIFKQKRSFAIRMSLGTSKIKVMIYYLKNILAITVISILIAIIFSGIFVDKVLNQTYEEINSGFASSASIFEVSVNENVGNFISYNIQYKNEGNFFYEIVIISAFILVFIVCISIVCINIVIRKKLIDTIKEEV